MTRLCDEISEFIRSLRLRMNSPVAEPELDDFEDTGPTLDPIPEEDSPMPDGVVVMRPVLSKGSSDKDAVIALQKALIANGESLVADGSFGPGTEAAVKALQTSYGMGGATGVVDAATWAVLDRPSFGTDPTYKGIPLPPAKTVAGSASVVKAWNAYGGILTTLGKVLGLPASVACAVLAVESAGAGFWDNRMVIRFENHVFRRSRWGKANPAEFDKHFKVDANETWKGHVWRPDTTGSWRVLHNEAAGQDEEWAVLTYARTLSDEDALQSISMGAPQIMGFNHAKVGFLTARAMFDAFSVDERAHVLGLFDFIRSDHKMVRALRSGDWTGFARIYNGSGQAVVYGQRIGDNVTAVKKLGVT